MIISVKKMPSLDVELYFYVRPQDSIDHLKDMIEMKIGIPSDVQVLLYGGQEMETGTIADYNIRDNTTLLLDTKTFAQIQVLVKRQEGAATTVTVKQNDFIDDLMEILKNEMDFKTNVEQLVYNGQILKTGLKLAYYKIPDGANIEIVKRSPCSQNAAHA